MDSSPSALTVGIVALSCLATLVVVGQPEDNPILIQDSGNNPVEKFATAIHIFIDFVNQGSTAYTVTVTPTQCCLFIEPNDTDCETMQLKPARELRLGTESDGYGNDSATAVFIFRNLYARYREGNCSFVIAHDGEVPMEWMHTIEINTYPGGDNGTFNCTGIDQDPDRDCSPVDCAIKYRGRRNFYRNSTGRCESVVECNTRGRDGVTNVAYYDWEENQCHRYDWLEEGENAYSHIESDTEIPEDVDPSHSEYFPDFEPHLLEQMAEAQIQLKCNHGRPDGLYCVCEEGWMSSGIHKDNPLDFHWCDARTADTTKYRYGPSELTLVQEISAIVALVLGNFVMLVVWLYLFYRLCCQRRCAAFCARLRTCYGWRKNIHSPSTEKLIQKND